MQQYEIKALGNDMVFVSLASYIVCARGHSNGELPPRQLIQWNPSPAFLERKFGTKICEAHLTLVVPREGKLGWDIDQFSDNYISYYLYNGIRQ